MKLVIEKNIKNDKDYINLVLVLKTKYNTEMRVLLKPAYELTKKQYSMYMSLIENEMKKEE